MSNYEEKWSSRLKIYNRKMSKIFVKLVIFKLSLSNKSKKSNITDKKQSKNRQRGCEQQGKKRTKEFSWQLLSTSQIHILPNFSLPSRNAKKSMIYSARNAFAFRRLCKTRISYPLIFKLK